MLLIRFFQAIDNSFIGKLIDKKLKLLDHTDPDRIYVENVRSFYNIPTFAAKFFCEIAVKERVFKKKIGVICPNDDCGRIITTIDDLAHLPKKVKCDLCELNEKSVFEFTPTKKDTIVFYQLIK